MRILLISDLAGKFPQFSPDMLSSINIVLLAGDITLGTKSVDKTIRTFEALGAVFPKPLPVYIIPGNHDYPYLAEDQPYIPENFVQMHNRWKSVPVTNEPGISQLVIIGFGGAKLGLYNNFAFTEEAIYASLETMFEASTEERKKPGSFTIMLVHDPPQNTALDYTLMKTHVGSRSVRSIITKFHPQLAVAGHIHESVATEKVGETMAVNPGEAKYGRYAIIEIAESTNISIRLLKIELEKKS